MKYLAQIVYILWIVFIVVWFTSALAAKRSVRGRYNNWLMYRLGVFAVIYLLIRYTNFFAALNSYYIPNFTVELAGTILCVLGLALALWARFYLGRNWGMPMSQKQNPELVDRGPYAYIRHPIYAGMLLAILGSVLTIGSVWIIIFPLYAVYFLYSAPVEEKNLARAFPDTYPAYKSRTKRLIPFVF